MRGDMDRATLGEADTTTDMVGWAAAPARFAMAYANTPAVQQLSEACLKLQLRTHTCLCVEACACGGHLWSLLPSATYWQIQAAPSQQQQQQQQQQQHYCSTSMQARCKLHTGLPAMVTA